MLVALYKMDKTGEMNYYYIHNYQGHLFSPHTITVLWGKNAGKGRELSFCFETKAAMNKKINELFTGKIREGFKLLYSYPQHSGCNELMSEASVELVS